MKPAAIINRFGLTNPIFLPTAAYGHIGREAYTGNVEVIENGVSKQKEVQFFGWERLDFVDKIKASFNLQLLVVRV